MVFRGYTMSIVTNMRIKILEMLYSGIAQINDGASVERTSEGFIDRFEPLFREHDDELKYIVSLSILSAFLAEEIAGSDLNTKEKYFLHLVSAGITEASFNHCMKKWG